MHRKITPRIVEEETTACREALIFDSYPDSDDESALGLADIPSLTIIATPQSHFVYR